MKDYVVGFAFDTADTGDVVLIEKQKPEWQKGLLNGVGGKMEARETPQSAMEREFKEEAGVLVYAMRWRHYATMSNRKHWTCRCFAAQLTPEEFKQVETCEAEKIVTCPTNIQSGVLTNLRWLIPMALDALKDDELYSADIQYAPTETRV